MARKLKIVGGEETAASPIHALNLPIDAIHPSKTNRTIDTESQKFLDLVESVKVHGIISNLLVRHLMDADGTDTGKYEIVHGERRWRAAKIAGRDTVPCNVRNLTNDGETLAMQITENAQREDYAPLELAAQVSKLKVAHRLSNGEVGRLLAIPEKRVSDLLIQLNLNESLKPLYIKGYLNTALVLYVARLMPVMQEKAIRTVFKDAFSSDLGQFDKEKTPIEEFVEHILKMERTEARPITERHLREWLKENVNLKLADAAWSLDDATLYPEAGPCTTCPQRSINNPELYAEVSGGKDLCMNPTCYAIKAKALVSIKKAEAKVESRPVLRLSSKETHTAQKEGATSLKKNQWVAAPSGKCEGIATGLITDGPNAGKEQRVCTDPGCSVHRHSGLWGSHVAQKPVEESEEEKAAKAAALEAVYNKRNTVIDAMIASQPSPARVLRMIMAEQFQHSYRNSHWNPVATLFQWGTLPDDYEERKSMIEKRVAKMDDTDFINAVLVYELGEHLTPPNPGYYVSDDSKQLRKKLAILGVPKKQISLIEAIPGADGDDDEEEGE